MNWFKGLMPNGKPVTKLATRSPSSSTARKVSASTKPVSKANAASRPVARTAGASAALQAGGEDGTPEFGSIQEPARRPQRRPGLPNMSTSDDVRDDQMDMGSQPMIAQEAGSESTSLVTIEEKLPTRKSFKEASITENEEFMKWSGDVVTAPHSAIPLTDTQRRYVALLSDGRLLIAKDKTLHEDTLAALQVIRRQGRPSDKGILVELDVLRAIYHNAEKNSPKGGQGRRGRGDGLQEMQKKVLALIEEASKLKASDIHIKVNRFEAEVLFRAQGVMQRKGLIESDEAHDLCTAAFNMADASDATYRPNEYQGARISDARNPLPEGVQSVRLQFNPLPNGGRYMICRLLYSNSQASTGSDVDSLGYTRVHIEQIVKMRRKPYGINIISGPTGSGKSTTLQRALTALMHEKRGTINVITIEDPPEYVIDGAAQLPVINAKTDEERREAFRAAISASLRSDPDVVMIGEMRDAASSNLAFAAAMTGHGVWASLHANDALSIVDRLRDQGIEIYKLTDETLVTGLIGQRLIRRLCPHCSVPFRSACDEGLIGGELAERIIGMIGEEKAVGVRASSGGEQCAHKGKSCSNGFAGREVVAETILPDSGFMVLVRENRKKDAYDYWLENLSGMTMPEHALQKLVDGKISPQDMEDKLGDITALDRERISKVLGELK